MTDPDAPCPRCGQSVVVRGSLPKWGGFRPEGLKLFSLSLQMPEVTVPNESTACLECGLVWSQLDADALRQKLRDLGTDETKQRLGLADSV